MFIHLLIVFRPHANVQMEAPLVCFIYLFFSLSLQHPDPRLRVPLLARALFFDIEDSPAPL